VIGNLLFISLSTLQGVLHLCNAINYYWKSHEVCTNKLQPTGHIQHTDTH